MINDNENSIPPFDSADKVQLRVMGVTYNPVQTGAYALLLGEVGGDRRIPVVVGMAEAQSIAAALERIKPQRPMTHDLMLSILHMCGISLDQVMIYQFDDGIFKSVIYLSQDGAEFGIDARTSDAIALAVRTQAPIYTTPGILNVTGILVHTPEGAKPHVQHHSLADLSVEQLQRHLNRLVEKEEYERAAEVQKIIQSKQASQDEPTHDELRQDE